MTRPHGAAAGLPVSGYREQVSGSPTPDDELAADWQRIRSGVAAVQHRLDHAVERAGVPAQWFAVLHMLLRAPEQGLPMTVLARDLAMTSGGFTKLADRMAKDGLVDRRGFAGDRRVVHAGLTEAGLALALRIEQVYLEALQRCVRDVVPPDELAAAGRTIAVLGAVHAQAPAVDDPSLLTTHRDPTLPDRRGRGRV